MFKDKAYHTEDGKVLYDNAPTVVIGLIETEFGILLIDRADGKGMALPGGFQMKGETWQQALSREVLEEVGLTVEAYQWSLHSRWGLPPLTTDEYGHNCVFAFAHLRHPVTLKLNPDEVKAHVFVSSQVQHHRLPAWAFPLHEQHYLAWLRDYVFKKVNSLG